MDILAIFLAAQSAATTYLYAIAVLGGIGVILAVLLAVSDATIANYGECTITVDLEDVKPIKVQGGSGTILNALFANKIFLPSACGGQGTCGYCKCRVLEGGGPATPVEEGFLDKKQIRAGWRLGCQVRVKNDMKIWFDPEILSIQEFKTRVQSNRNVATFIKELILELVEPAQMKFKAGHYIQVHVPNYKCSFRDFEIAEQYRGDYDKYKLWDFHAENKAGEICRAYSMASEPQDNKRVILNVRIATPPPNSKFPPGVGSSYIFNLKPGDEVKISGPYGDFFIKDTDREMVYLGGGAGMAPMRSHLFYLLKEVHSQRKISFFYGARSMREMFYHEEFQELAAKNPNFTYTVALSEPLPQDNWTGPKGFIHQVCDDLFLSKHPDPKQVEYYLCGPPMMIDAVLAMLDKKYHVPQQMIAYDKF